MSFYKVWVMSQYIHETKPSKCLPVIIELSCQFRKFWFADARNGPELLTGVAIVWCSSCMMHCQRQCSNCFASFRQSFVLSLSCISLSNCCSWWRNLSARLNVHWVHFLSVESLPFPKRRCRCWIVPWRFCFAYPLLFFSCQFGACFFCIDDLDDLKLGGKPKLIQTLKKRTKRCIAMCQGSNDPAWLRPFNPGTQLLLPYFCLGSPQSHHVKLGGEMFLILAFLYVWRELMLGAPSFPPFWVASFQEVPQGIKILLDPLVSLLNLDASLPPGRICYISPDALSF